MHYFVENLSRRCALTGGIVLTLLAILVSISVLGGITAKIAYSDALIRSFPRFAHWLQDSGIRTIPAIYEIMTLGIAFVIFAFLPITTFYRAHAVVDVFTNAMPPSLVRFLIAFWETVFLIILALITWRLALGTERLIKTNAQLVELQIPEWWGYAVACVQMAITTLVSFYVCASLWNKVIRGEPITSPLDSIHT